ncbi:MAG: uracil-DNA glycosylase family protein [Bacteroidota bacterium]|nr:uracil-DNA glycosylase family protein [Bacteroidota bacterium]
MKPYVAKDLHEGLKILINYILEKHTSFKIKSSDIYSNEELIIILTSLLKDTNKFSLQAKQIFYNRLVFERKKYQYSDPVILNPAKLDISNDEHLNAWAYWHSDLNADILLIGQDFGGYAYYSNYDGKDDPENKTNINLACLFSQLEIDLGQSDAPNINAKLYFTNAVLGVKNGAMSAPIKKGWYSDTAIKFIKPLIEIIQPKIIIALGSKAYDVVSMIYSLDKKPMKEIIDANPISLPDNKKLFVVYHCSNLGIANRSFDTQREDWKKIKAYMEQNGC